MKPAPGYIMSTLILRISLLLYSKSILPILYHNVHIQFLYFTVKGCPDFHNPPNTWLDKHNDTITVGCITNSDTWRLKCVNNGWLGHKGNCTTSELFITGSKWFTDYFQLLLLDQFSRSCTFTDVFTKSMRVYTTYTVKSIVQ